ncbi:MAG: VOC family protein [Gammaproteobacteria bacterium]
MSSWSVTTVGVADLEVALSLWQGDFGFEIAARRNGPDPELARLWKISPEDISAQALVRTPGIDVGMLHLVEFVDPEPPVREGALAYDLCLKNLDVYTDDLPRRFAGLRAQGRRFSNDDYSEVTAPSGITFREIHMPSHDRVNVVLLEILGAALPVSPAGFSGIGMLIGIVPDAAAEKAFYRDILGLDMLSDNILEGPEIEKMVGLPAGAALDISIWGRAESDFGRMEVIEYQGARGNDLYPATRPKALGILHVTYATDDLQPLRTKLAAAAIQFEEIGPASTIFSDGPMLSFRSPAGMRIDVYQE